MRKQFFLYCIVFSFIGKGYSYTGEAVKSFPLPCTFPAGLTYDGKNLWLADRKADSLFCLDIETGAVIRKIASPGYWPMGLAWDGKYLWNSDIRGGTDIYEDYNGKIYKLDPEDGTILATITPPCKAPRGLTWDGTYLWCTDNHSDMIYQISGDDGTLINSFPSPTRCRNGLSFSGLAWDGKYLWTTDRYKDEIYMIDPATGYVIIIADAPGPYTRGLAYDGEFLWAVDYQEKKLYKLKIRDDELFKKKNPRKGKIIYTHETRNFGPGNIKTLDVHIAIPEKRTCQDIHGEVTCSPVPSEISTDQWGQKTAHFHKENMVPGKVVRYEMTMSFTLYDVDYHIYPEKVGTVDDIPKDLKEKFLADNYKYGITDPVIQKALNEAVGDETNVYWIVRKIVQYLVDNMYYHMDGAWDTAPTIIQRGNGSCSEYSFAFISICRASGIPTRYVGSIAYQYDDEAMDEIFHRWPEVFMPGYGWIPVDPTHCDREYPRDQAAGIGREENRYLITTQGAGNSKTLGWTYNSREFYTTDPKTNVNTDHFADWRTE